MECCEMGKSGDPSFVLKLLLALYGPEDLQLRSITGKPSRNTNYRQVKTKKIEPEKLQFIKGMCCELIHLQYCKKSIYMQRDFASE